MILSTKQKIQTRSGETLKPKVIIDSNNCKIFINFSDQQKVYNSSLRKGNKCYIKLANYLWAGIFVFFYTKITQNKISKTQFRDAVLMEIILKQAKKQSNIFRETHAGTRSVCGYFT